MNFFVRFDSSSFTSRVIKPMSLALLLLFYRVSPAQHTVGFGNIATLNPNSLLHFNASTQGVLFPSMTSVERSAITSPAEGLLVYDTSRKIFYLYTANGWQALHPVHPKTVYMWYGSPSEFDATGKGTGRMLGWALCNGQNGTPDLRGRFVAGYDDRNPDFAAIGTSDLGGDVVSLGIDQLPAHAHAVTDTGHTHVPGPVISPGHSHRLSFTNNRKSNSYGLPNDNGIQRGSTGLPASVSLNLSEAIWSLSASLDDAGLSLSGTGSGQSHENLPPYVATFFIQKL